MLVGKVAMIVLSMGLFFGNGVLDNSGGVKFSDFINSTSKSKNSSEEKVVSTIDRRVSYNNRFNSMLKGYVDLNSTEDLDNYIEEPTLASIDETTEENFEIDNEADLDEVETIPDELEVETTTEHVHDYELISATQANLYSCRECGYEYSEVNPSWVDPESETEHQHSWELISAMQQNTYRCSVCGTEFSEPNPSWRDPAPETVAPAQAYTGRPTVARGVYDVNIGGAAPPEVVEYARNIAINRINQMRARVGVGPVQWDSMCLSAANVRSYEATILWSHTRPNGEKGSQMIQPPYVGGEVLGNCNSGTYDYYGAADYLINWLLDLMWDHEPHRNIIINPAWVYTGVGIYYYDTGSGWGICMAGLFSN